MKKIIRKAVALFVSFAIIATNMVSVNNQSLIHAQDELVNVALNEGVQVYTKPNVNNGKNIVDGDTRYQYVTQGARNYIDLSFKDSSLDKTMEQDENGYYYNSDAYIIVDLGKTYSLSSLKVYDFEREGGFERDYIYDIYVSNDPDFDIDFEYNVNWQKVGSKEPNSGKYVTEFALENNIAARYIKLGNLKCKNAEGFVVEKALDAVIPDLDITHQEEVNAMAKAIEDAIRALEYKDADYSAVEKTKEKVPADLSIYTEESVKALNDALACVVEGKNITEQKEVDTMAKAIENAINGLVKKDTGKPEDPTEPSEPETPSEPEGPNTSDNYHVAVFAGLMILSAGVLAFVLLRRKREEK